MSTMALLSSPPILTPPSRSYGKTRLILKHPLSFTPKKRLLLSLSTRATDSTLEDQKVSEASALESDQKLGRNGSPPVDEAVAKFEEPRWVNGTWDLKQFAKEGKTDWDAVIGAEVTRRRWLENNPESTNNEDPIVFDTSIIPWWAWVKRFHLPEAERLNGRAAMIGFFMAYFVDSLTGVGLVDQMGNFFCKTLLFVAVSGVLLVRKNEDLETLKRLVDESTFYDKQWQATWKDETKET